MKTESNQQNLLKEANSILLEWGPDIIGCFGTIVVLLAYVLLQIRKLDSHDVLFSFLNLTGGLMMLISLFYSWNLAAVAMEVAWILISGFGMFKVLFPQAFRLKKFKRSIF
jgi:hypothetical protein